MSTRKKESLYLEQATTVIIPANLETLRTQRLVLRPLEMTDAPSIFDYRCRQDVADWLWPKIPHKDIKETEAVIASKTFQTLDASGALGRKFIFAIIPANDPNQRVIGAAGINALVPGPSIGYGIHPEFWGYGYATEAVQALVDAWWKLPRELPEQSRAAETEKLYSACNKANAGSTKVLLKTGFKIYEEISVEDDVVALFEQERPRN
ncbi:Acyl-CoA N-acyltransferase [Penicillium alfredii]|uniref:Acyl-CoA N-acyltransferase n=1 Tax=Penicillium alfredii TaxID=1506179 RepID=A0A9W9JYG0_9EURO|nr:Acyl-CoA N-acyltransferase [Penicillium alfredii]KAJ5086594.1 Acyl-CoA N-acyltransferase [Penicillium alfredii]